MYNKSSDAIMESFMPIRIRHRDNNIASTHLPDNSHWLDPKQCFTRRRLIPQSCLRFIWININNVRRRCTDYDGAIR